MLLRVADGVADDQRAGERPGEVNPVREAQVLDRRRPARDLVVRDQQPPGARAVVDVLGEYRRAGGIEGGALVVNAVVVDFDVLAPVARGVRLDVYPADAAGAARATGPQNGVAVNPHVRGVDDGDAGGGGRDDRVPRRHAAPRVVACRRRPAELYADGGDALQRVPNRRAGRAVAEGD